MEKAAEFKSNGLRILKNVRHEISSHFKKKGEYVEDRINDRPTQSYKNITTDLNRSINGLKTGYQPLPPLSWTQNVSGDLLADSHNNLNLRIFSSSSSF